MRLLLVDFFFAGETGFDQFHQRIQCCFRIVPSGLERKLCALFSGERQHRQDAFPINALTRFHDFDFRIKLA